MSAIFLPTLILLLVLWSAARGNYGCSSSSFYRKAGHSKEFDSDETKTYVHLVRAWGIMGLN